MTDETPTPRTDAMSDYDGARDVCEHVVPSDFARTLERECAELRERLSVAEAAAAKAREDALRLDWLDARRNHTQFPELGRKNIVVVECKEGQSLRAAIDAAREPHRG